MLKGTVFIVWDITIESSIIQLEIGSKVISAYSSQMFSKKCDILIKKINTLRNELMQDGFILSPINIRDSDKIKPKEYILYFGVYSFKGDYLKNNIIEVIKYYANIHRMNDFSYEKVVGYFNENVKFVENKNYQKAIHEFAKLYYIASLRDDTIDIMVNSIINICGIQFINQQYDNALMSINRACTITMSDSFYNPFLKYYSEIWKGIINLQMNCRKDAIRCFSLAYNAIGNTDENKLKLSTLINLSYIYYQEHDLYNSAKMLELIIDILEKDPSLDFDKSFILNLAMFQSSVYNAYINQISYEYDILNQKFSDYSQKFLVKLKNQALNIFFECGKTFIHVCIGMLLGADNITAQFSVVGDNRITKY